MLLFLETLYFLRSRTSVSHEASRFIRLSNSNSTVKFLRMLFVQLERLQTVLGILAAASAMGGHGFEVCLITLDVA